MRLSAHLLTLALAVVALVGPGCDGEAGDDTLGGGDYIFTTTVVDDRCLDGGLNLLFMPNGVDTPWDWPFEIGVQSQAALPATYDIMLRQPFGTMTVTIKDDDPDPATILFIDGFESGNLDAWYAHSP